MTWPVPLDVNASAGAADAAAAAAYDAALLGWRNGTVTAECLSFVPTLECAAQFPACSDSGAPQGVCRFICEEYNRRCSGSLPARRCEDPGRICAASVEQRVSLWALGAALAVAWAGS